MNSRQHEIVQRALRPGRREFLVAASVASAGAWLAGCATDPVTGRNRMMLVGEGYERDVDRQWAPHQFSADYGSVQDPGLNAYVTSVGQRLTPHTHRPGMPYNMRVVNAVNVNGYTFPAGSVALTRGLLLSLNNEAEMAAVLGHEFGHVSAVHAREQMQKGMLVMAIVAGVGIYLEHEKVKYADLAVGLGAVGANLLLMRYSRENEREADDLGMQYLVKGGYTPQGMVGVMDGFRAMQKTKPGAIDLLFATHPMSDERYATAAQRVRTTYAGAAGNPDYRDRYMDQTAGLRRQRGAIEAMQQGESSMMAKRLGEAEGQFSRALTQAPDDYAANLLMAKCLVAQNKNGAAQRFLEKARSVYPEEAQVYNLEGVNQLQQRRFDAALAAFDVYERKLPGNPNTIFFKGFCNESMGRRQAAAQEYLRYNQIAPNGEYGEQVQSRLIEWKVIAPPAPSAQPAS